MKSYLITYLERFQKLLPLVFILFFLGVFLNVSMLYVLRANGGFDAEHLLQTSIASLFWAVVLPMFLPLIPWRGFRRGLSLGILILCICLYILESFLIWVEKTPLTDGILTSLLHTNPAEATDYLSSFQSNPELLYSFLYLALILLIGALLGRLTKRLRANPFILLVFLVIPTYLLTVRPIMMKGDHFNSSKYKSSSIVERLYFAGDEAFAEWRSLRYLYRSLEENKSKLQYTVHKDLGEHSIILIQGESLSREFMSLYGYPLQTTPLLDKLKEEGNLYVFDDVVSSSGYTPTSIKHIFSYYLLDSDKDWIHYPLLTDIFNSLGYQTYWLSNQESRGYYLTPINIISEVTKEQFFLNPSAFHDLSHKIEYDEALLPHLKFRTKDYQADKFFEVIHLMGNHVNYSARFPASYWKFDVNDLKDKGIDVPRPQVLVNYLNSIFYNDWVVHEIIQHYKYEKAIVLYLSDHGQEMFRDEHNPNHFAHSNEPLGRDIPFMIYLTEPMKDEHPEIVEQIDQALHKPFMTDALPESILGLIGVELDAYKNRKTNLFSKDYDTSRSRTIN